MFEKARAGVGIAVAAGAIAVAVVACSGAPEIHVTPGMNTLVGGVSFRLPTLHAPTLSPFLGQSAQTVPMTSHDQTVGTTHNLNACPIALPE